MWSLFWIFEFEFPVILSQDALNQLDVLNYEPTWTIRYQVHVKCRGLLTAKGFVVGANRRKWFIFHENKSKILITNPLNG